MSGNGLTPRTSVTPRGMDQPLPFLPGHVAHDVTKKNHSLPQTLVYRLDASTDTMKQRPSGVMPKLSLADLEPLKDPAFRLNTDRPALTHDERRELANSARNTYRPKIEPAWLKHDRQVLRFHAYFQEPVHENPIENFRVRRCTILFYLEDGTMQIVEKKVENAGIPQGAFVKRHRIPRPEGGGFYSPGDLKMGTSVTVYARTFRICSCDEFTAWFYKTAGMDLGQPEDEPIDQFSVSEAAKKEGGQGGSVPRDVVEGKEFTELMLGGSRKNAKLSQFITNDRKVLRFYCYWDDHTRYGTRQYYILLYFLADDSVQILECYGRNSGRDPYPVLYKRAPLLKNPTISATPGMLEADPVCVKPTDLEVGKTVDVFGRALFLYDCDDFTRSFYRDYSGVEQASMPIQDEVKERVQFPIPPHFGFGSEEDSLMTCLSLRPKPPRQDLLKLMTNSEKVLRFEARMDNGLPEDKARKFVLGFFLADDSVALYEISERNSGHWGGKFAERSRKRNPDTDAWFRAGDFFVGATVTVNSCPFFIYRSDEYTLKFMETYPEVFPQADIRLICEKLRPLKDSAKIQGQRTISPDHLRELVLSELDGMLRDQELITLLRFLGNGPASPDIDVMKLSKAIENPRNAFSLKQ